MATRAASLPHARLRPSRGTPVVGTVTRGTTNPNRLRRMDRWIAAVHGAELRGTPEPVAVDLGYGAAPWTAVELLARLRTAAPRTHVFGVEIEPARVAAALPYEREGLAFLHGGFEVPVPGRPHLIRAANVLRQYDEAAAATAWVTLRGGLAVGGLLVEGTCDEIGRRGSWVLLDRDGPVSLTFACRVGDLERPSDLAERLPKALIHHNVAGQPIHELLSDLDGAWRDAAPLSTFGPRQRWIAACQALGSHWQADHRRARYGELTVPWSAVAPT